MSKLLTQNSDQLNPQKIKALLLRYRNISLTPAAGLSGEREGIILLSNLFSEYFRYLILNKYQIICQASSQINFIEAALPQLLKQGEFNLKAYLTGCRIQKIQKVILSGAGLLTEEQREEFYQDVKLFIEQTISLNQEQKIAQ